uniref:Uncharacterized protein n=1 Tax=Oryza brachyantha TaxID=4533 RepID=J3LL52_ORYBR
MPRGSPLRPPQPTRQRVVGYCAVLVAVRPCKITAPGRKRRGFLRSAGGGEETRAVDDTAACWARHARGWQAAAFQQDRRLLGSNSNSIVLLTRKE